MPKVLPPQPHPSTEWLTFADLLCRMDRARAGVHEGDVWVDGEVPDRDAEDHLTRALAEAKLTAWGERGDGSFAEVPAVYWSKHVASGMTGLRAFGHAFGCYRLLRVDAERVGFLGPPPRRSPPAPKHEKERQAWPLLDQIHIDAPALSQGRCARELLARWDKHDPKPPSPSSCERYVRAYRTGR